MSSHFLNIVLTSHNVDFTILITLIYNEYFTKIGEYT